MRERSMEKDQFWITVLDLLKVLPICRIAVGVAEQMQLSLAFPIPPAKSFQQHMDTLGRNELADVPKPHTFAGAFGGKRIKPGKVMSALNNSNLPLDTAAPQSLSKVI